MEIPTRWTARLGDAWPSAIGIQKDVNVMKTTMVHGRGLVGLAATALWLTACDSVNEPQEGPEDAMMTERSASIPALANDEDDSMATLDDSPQVAGSTDTTNTTNSTNSTNSTDETDVISMGLGDGESWVVMSDGTVKGWGKRYCSRDECFVPADNEPLALDDAAVEIHSNGSQGAVRLANGDVFVWDEHSGTPDEFHLAPFDGEPVQVALGLDFLCAVLDRGEVDCQPLPGQSVPQPGWLSEFESPTEIVELSAGAHHACALDEWGTVICWGDNDSSQLGPPSDADSTTIELDGPAHSIAAGGAHTCALLDNGTVQ